MNTHAVDLRDRAQSAVQAEAEAAKAARIERMVHRWRHASILLGWEGWCLHCMQCSSVQQLDTVVAVMLVMTLCVLGS